MKFLLGYLAFRAAWFWLFFPGYLRSVNLPWISERAVLTVLHLMLATLDLSVVLYLMHRLSKRPSARALLKPWVGRLGKLLLVFAFVQATCWIALEYAVAASEKTSRNLYARHFAPTANTVGAEYFFKCHPNLCYSLNPQAKYRGSYQFNSEFFVRRTEPLAARVPTESPRRFRILAIGGSTTFGEGTNDEQDTWVCRLENLYRAKYGQHCDVINCGVPAYTVLENFIHYIAHLHFLEPDVVILTVGLNDVNPRLNPDLKTDYTNYRHCWSDDALPEPSAGLKWCYPYRLYYFQRYLVPAPHLSIDNFVTYPRVLDPRLDAQNAARNGTAVYRSHLDNFVQLLLHQGHKVALVPQIARRSDMAPLLAQHNQINREIAKHHDLPFFQGMLQKDLILNEDLIDAMHFNKSGHAKVAFALADFLESKGCAPKGRKGEGEKGR